MQLGSLEFQMAIAVAEAMAGLTAMPVARVAANRAAMAKSVERKNISILLFRPGEAGWGWGDPSGWRGHFAVRAAESFIALVRLGRCFNSTMMHLGSANARPLRQSVRAARPARSTRADFTRF